MAKLLAYVKEGVWEGDPAALGPCARFGVRLLRFLSVTVFGFLDHRCALHAAGLTYFTLLAIVPVLCLLMVCAKMCGADDFARREIDARITAFVGDIERGAEQRQADDTPAGREAAARCTVARSVAAQARTFSTQLFDRIATFDIRTFGWIGFAMLMWTVISSFSQIETSINEIWSVGRPRPIWKRSLLYLFLAGVVPLLAAAALSMPILRGTKAVVDATLGATAYTKWAGDALVMLIDSKLFGFAVSFLFSALAFACLLAVMPHCRVRARAALEGGAITALLFGGWIRLCTTAQVGIGKSSAFYGSFAAPVILLAWIYMSWQIVLLGGNMVYAFQCVHNGTRDRLDR